MSRRYIFIKRRNYMPISLTNLLLAGILAILLIAAIWDSVSL